jgi:hypothetical protein
VAKCQRAADDRAAQEAATADDKDVQHGLCLSRTEGMPLRSMPMRQRSLYACIARLPSFCTVPGFAKWSWKKATWEGPM